jgi:hypothetical protein
MIDDRDLKNVTPEQKREINGIVSKARLSILLTVLKFGVGLFITNLISIAIGGYFLSDTDVEMQEGFQFVSLILNTILMGLYMHFNLRKINDDIAKKVKEILNK